MNLPNRNEKTWPQKTCTIMLIVALVILAQNWEQTGCSSVGGWIDKLWIQQYFPNRKRGDIATPNWNRKRHRSLDCLSLPNPRSRDRHRVFIQMAGDVRGWRVHTLTDHLVFSFQAKVFIAGNKQGVVRSSEIQGGVNWIKKTTPAF